MALRVVSAELIKTLTAQISLFNSGPYKCGLFQGAFSPSYTNVIGDITPATFGGYAGLKNLTSWGAITFVSPRAVCNHGSLVWTADGSSANSIGGYYVVDSAGALAWVEPRVDGVITVGALGQTYTVIPQYTRRSEF